MSTQRQERVPALTLGWRLKMALGFGDISRSEMAEHLGVEASTVSRWCAERGAPPKRAYLMQWALRADVDLDWLEHGIGSATPPPDPAGVPDELTELTEAKRARHGRNRPNTDNPHRYLDAA